jgi:hypothetical protein
VFISVQTALILLPWISSEENPWARKTAEAQPAEWPAVPPAAFFWARRLVRVEALYRVPQIKSVKGLFDLLFCAVHHRSVVS